VTHVLEVKLIHCGGQQCVSLRRQPQRRLRRMWHPPVQRWTRRCYAVWTEVGLLCGLSPVSFKKFSQVLVEFSSILQSAVCWVSSLIY